MLCQNKTLVLKMIATSSCITSLIMIFSFAICYLLLWSSWDAVTVTVISFFTKVPVLRGPAGLVCWKEEVVLIWPSSRRHFRHVKHSEC